MVTNFRIVIRVTTTEDFEFKVEANTREEARGKSLRQLRDLYREQVPIHTNREERFVSTKAIGAAENPPNK